MKIKSAVFLVESPMQLINAIEAKHYFGIQDSSIIIRYDGIAANDDHIDYVLKTIDNSFTRIINIILLYGKKNLYKMLIPLFVSIKYKPDYLFIGNYYSGYAKITRLLYPNRKCIYLDDGAQTTKLYYDNKNINLFSYFSFTEKFPDRMYIHHSFSYLKQKLSEKHQTVSKGVIYFIGTALVENDLISESNYEKIVVSLVDHYSEYNIKYFPHRFENLEKLRAISQFEIVQANMPFELYLLQTKVLPEKIVSFYSAALYTVNSIMGDIVEVEAFRIPAEYFKNSEYAAKIDNLYNYLSESLTIIEDNNDI